MLKILVTYAVQGEFVEIKWPDVEPYYIRTGIGKVKSAFHLAEAIRQVQPDLVLNLGSAGTVNHQVGDIFVCRKFIDRDMQKLAGLGMECEIDSSALLETKGFCKHWTEEGICNTGRWFPDGTDSRKRRCRRHGSVCAKPSSAVPKRFLLFL